VIHQPGGSPWKLTSMMNSPPWHCGPGQRRRGAVRPGPAADTRQPATLGQLRGLAAFRGGL